VFGFLSCSLLPYILDSGRHSAIQVFIGVKADSAGSLSTAFVCRLRLNKRNCLGIVRVLLKREAKRRNAKLLKRETVVRNGPKNYRDRFAV
jgi:hypothetical protein